MSKNSKTRTAAEHLVSLADKVYHYRKDLMPERAVEDLIRFRDKLILALNEKSDDASLLHRMDDLEALMKKHGGNIYPQKFIPENVEVILVAAILAIGVRSYFFQPFKIPTNSMYPTYNGMTTEVFNEQNPRPGTLQSMLRKLMLWTSAYEIKSPGEGEVLLPLSKDGHLAYVDSGSGRDYTVVIKNDLGMKAVTLKLPQEFSLEENVIIKTFYPGLKSYSDVLSYSRQNGLVESFSNGVFLKTGKHVKKGEELFNFDILTGDMLFVDRISYHFVKPTIGDPIVFRTDEIPEIKGDFYYIKRLVGTGGDTLQVDAPYLIRNEKPISGADAFLKNAGREGEYPGYSYYGMLKQGDTVTVPEHYFYAMGDNSSNSSDSRVWGFVPETSVVGRAFCIYYPFTKRWGLAK